MRLVLRAESGGSVGRSVVVPCLLLLVKRLHASEDLNAACKTRAERVEARRRSQVKPISLFHRGSRLPTTEVPQGKASIPPSNRRWGCASHPTQMGEFPLLAQSSVFMLECCLLHEYPNNHRPLKPSGKKLAGRQTRQALACSTTIPPHDVQASIEGPASRVNEGGLVK